MSLARIALVRASTIRALPVPSALPDGVKDRTGWTTGIHAALAALEIPATPDNICAAVAVTSQESEFQVD